MKDQEFSEIQEIENQDILYSRDISEQIDSELLQYQLGKWWMHLLNGIYLMVNIFTLVGSWITFNMNCSKSYVVLIILMILFISVQLFNVIDSKLQRRRQLYVITGLCSVGQFIFLIVFIVTLSQNIYCSNAICHPYFNGEWYQNSVKIPSDQLTNTCNAMKTQYSDNNLSLSNAIQESVQQTANSYCTNLQDPTSVECDSLKHFQVETLFSSTFFYGAIMISAFVLGYTIVIIFIIKKMITLEKQRGKSFESTVSESNSIPYNNYY